MKTNPLVLFASVLLATSADAQLKVLLGGFDGIAPVNDPLQSTLAANDGVSVELALSGGAVSYGWAGGGTSNSTWGTQSFAPLPSTGTAETTGRIDTPPGTYTFTITAGTSDLNVQSLHWIGRRDGSNSTDTATVSFVSSTDGDLGAGTPAVVSMTTIGAHTGYDADLTGVFTGTTLSAGETMVIQWVGTHSTGQNQRIRMDNFAVAGEVLVSDSSPPTPNPSTWASVPTAIGESSITMTATTATDAEGSGVQYNFVCTLGGGADSGWQSGPEYTDTGLTPGTEYRYTVTTRDLLGNTGAASSEESATTFPADGTPPNPDPITFALAPTPVSPTAITMTATTATDTHGVEYQFIETSGNSGGTNSGWQDSPVYIDSGLSPNTEYTYRVECRDKSIAQNATGTTTASATTHAAAGIGTVLVGGYHGANETALQSATISNIPVTLTSNTGDITQGNGAFNSNALWGNSALDTPAEINTASIIQVGTTTTRTLTMTVTNNESVDLPLVGFHIKIRDDSTACPDEFNLAYTAGDLGAPLSINVGKPSAATTEYDIPLASFLSDTTLAPGESATFVWTSGEPVNPLGNTTWRIDAIALSADAIAGGSAFDTWAATGTLPGTVTFEGDLNGDGVQDGLAFLLGAADPDVDATGLLPTISESGGDLVMAFDCLATAERGASVLNLEYDGDLAGTWLSVPVPGAEGAPNPIVEATASGSVSFVATDGGTNGNGDALIDIVATISDATESAAGKLFGRLKATQ